MVFDFTCLATRKAKARSVSSALVGGRLVTTLSIMSSTTALSRDCTSKPPATDFTIMPPARGSGRPPAMSKRRFFLAPTMAIASSLASGAMITSVKMSVMARAASASSLRFTATIPPKADTGSQASALSGAAWIGVLDDDASGRALGIELGDAFVGRVGVVNVVVGKLFALHLARGGDAGPQSAGAIERRRLMRVLAVAQRFNQAAADCTEGGRGIGELIREPVGDRGVIDAGASIGLGGELAAQRKRRRAAVLPELCQHDRIVAGIDHDRHLGVILGGGADHGGTADVDILDAGFEIGALCHGCLE